VVLATGIRPRRPEIDGIDHPKALSYLDVLRDDASVGQRVAIVGAGGIGFDVAEYLTHPDHGAGAAPEPFYAEWGVDTAYAEGGGLKPAHPQAAARQVHLLQRKASKVGDQLGKTTGWIHRTALKARGVAMSASVHYQRIDDAGLHLSVDGQPQTLAVDHVVICAGQEPERSLYEILQAGGRPVHLIGGAHDAAELDAKRAIAQVTALAAAL
jgi:2,4-dienoyl-CoA reductase (NADPH2)